MSGGAETEFKLAFFIVHVCTDVCVNNVCTLEVFCGRTKLPFDGARAHDESSDISESFVSSPACGLPSLKSSR